VIDEDVQGDFSPLQPLETRNSVAMEAAFDTAWNSYCTTGIRLTAEAARDARNRMAKAICERFREGERDPLRLHDIALASLETLYPGE
jgi:hypothetical protein